MKYNFNLENDIVSLKYKDKEFSFKVNVSDVASLLFATFWSNFNASSGLDK